MALVSPKAFDFLQLIPVSVFSIHPAVTPILRICDVRLKSRMKRARGFGPKANGVRDFNLTSHMCIKFRACNREGLGSISAVWVRLG